jgi:DNA (cytosine-5)-methyltransferase 1
MLRHCGLFEGIGGFTRAAEQVGGIQTTQFVEINPDAQTILRDHFPSRCLLTHWTTKPLTPVLT